VSRIFDHMNGEPEDKWFSKVARQMQQSPWWLTRPKRTEPAPVSGEIESKR
jgi:hypothetical protein